MFLIIHFYAVVAITTAFQFLSVNLGVSDTPTLVAHRFVFGTMLASLVGRLVGIMSWFAFAHKFSNSLILDKNKREPTLTSALLLHYFVLTHPATDTLGWWQAILTSQTVAHRRLNPFLFAIAHSSFYLSSFSKSVLRR